MKSHDLFGLVLIGGQSKRMGTDKSLLKYHHINQREYCYHLLSRFCSQVFFSCNKSQVKSLNYPFMVDKEARGPISGILSAFKHYPHRAWLVLACDMPWVDDAMITTLISHRRQDNLATCFCHNFPEPLCTIYEPDSYEKLAGYVASGRNSPRLFLETNAVHFIPADRNCQGKLKNINGLR